MVNRATFVIVALIATAAVCAAEKKTPDKLLGRWRVVKSQNQGELQTFSGMQIEIEFTSSQLQLRIYRLSDERPQPTYIGDCCFDSKNGLLMFDTITANNSPGPETERGIHVCSIYKIEGDTLTICSGHSDDSEMAAERPTEFVSSREIKSDLMVLKRKN